MIFYLNVLTASHGMNSGVLWEGDDFLPECSNSISWNEFKCSVGK